MLPLPLAVATPLSLVQMITPTATAYPLLPSCITLVGRHPRDTTYLASLYSIGKQGLRGLEYGPEVGGTRLEALHKLFNAVEMEIGRMLVRDGKRADREAQEGRREEGRREGGSTREVGLVRWEKGKNERANWE